MNTKTKKIFLTLFSFFIALFLPRLVFSASFTYTLMEKIPGFDTSSDFSSYILAVYKFGIWAVGIAALFMIMVGGFMYITSAGNNASMEKAKGIIFDAVAGVLLALTAYLLLYVINPELVKIKNISGTVSTSSSSSSIGVGSTGKADGSTLDSNCSQVNSACSSNSQGVRSVILKIIVAGGEGCNKSLSSDGYGSCGYSQALPSTRTACGISGSNAETCAKIQNDVQLDINCAAWLIKHQAGSCGTDDYVKVGCCYNGGPSQSSCTTNGWYKNKLNSYYSKYYSPSI